MKRRIRFNFVALALAVSWFIIGWTAKGWWINEASLYTPEQVTEIVFQAQGREVPE